MGDSDNPEHTAKGLSAGQMAVLFLAGAAVCAVFFSAGFMVGYNEKSSSAAPLTERISQSSDIPPVVAQDEPKSSGEPPRSSSSELTPSTEDAQSVPLRPRPLSSEKNKASESQSKSGTGPLTPTVLGPPRAAGRAAISNDSAGAQGGIFAIQVAATGTKPDAEKMVIALKSLDYPVNLVTPEQAHAGDNLYRVQVGPFATRESAEKVKARLVQDGFKQPFIKH